MADPNFASVVLLAGNENGSGTAFLDQSNSAHTLSAVGNTVWTTTSPPTGLTSTVIFDGTGDQLTSAASSDWAFGSGDFTVEFMVNMAAVTANATWFIAQDAYPAATRNWGAFMNATNSLQFYYFRSASFVPLSFSWTPSTGTWYHVALCRSGANLRLFINGTQTGATANIGTDTIDSGACALRIGGLDGAGLQMNGKQASIRITKGVARYTADFTAPSLPLPTSAVDAPVANFTGTPTSGTTPLSVTFTDASTNTPTSWLWERTSDGTNWTSFSTSQNPTQSFTTGTWGVRLTATNAGGSNTKTSLAYITVAAPAGGTPTIISFASRGVDWAEVERIKLEKALARKKVELKKVAKKIKAAEKKVEVPDPPRGILANLHLLEQKEAKLQVEIAELAITIEGMVDFLSKLEFEDDDEDDDWLHLI